MEKLADVIIAEKFLNTLVICTITIQKSIIEFILDISGRILQQLNIDIGAAKDGIIFKNLYNTNKHVITR